MADETITAAELNEEDCYDIEDEIRADVSKLSSYVQRPDYKMCEFMREERSEEEMELKAAVEVFNGDQDEVKKQLNKLPMEFGDKRGLEQEMYRFIRENKIEDSRRVKDDNVSEKKSNEIQSESDCSSNRVDLDCETSMKTEGLEQKLCRLLSDFGGSDKDFDAVKAGIKDLFKEEDMKCDLKNDIGNSLNTKLKEMKKVSDGSVDGAEREVRAIVVGLIRQLFDLTQQLCDLTSDIRHDLRKKLEAMQKEFNQSVYGTEHEVHPTVEELTQKLCDLMSDIGNNLEELKERRRESHLYDNQAESETSGNVEGLEQKMYGLMREGGRSHENFEVSRAETEGYKNKQTDDECKRLSEELVIAEIGGFKSDKEDDVEEKTVNAKKSESAEFGEKSDNSIDMEIHTNIEGLAQEMYELMRQAEKSTAKLEKEEQEDDLKKKKLNRLMKNATESDEECEAEISSLQEDLVVLMLEREKAGAKFQQLKSELELLNQSNCEKEMELVELVKSKMAAILEPIDHEVRDRVDSLLQSQIDQLMKQTKAKMVQAESEEIESSSSMDEMHNELADSTVANGGAELITGTTAEDKSLDAEKGLKLICPSVEVVAGAVAALFRLRNTKVQRK